jgi:hypothetical protein
MKNSYLITLSLFILLISGCIPSLHPIYTEKDRIIDDRLLGSWKMYDDDLPNFGFTVESDDEEDQKEGERLMKELEDENIPHSSSWTFERAADYEGEFKLSGGKATFSFSPGARSFLPENSIIKNEKELPYYFLTHHSYNMGDTIKNYMIVNLTRIAGQLYMDFYPYDLKDEKSRSRFASNYINGHTFARVEFKDNKVMMYPFNIDYFTTLLKEKRIRLKHENLGEDNIVLTASTKELRAFIANYGDDEELYEGPEELVMD